MICPDCKRDMDFEEKNVYICRVCGNILHAESIEPCKNYQILPELRVGSEIYINNMEHKFNLEQGVILSKDHRHYKVKLSGKIIIWVPEHWVEPLPKELRGDVQDISSS